MGLLKLFSRAAAPLVPLPRGSFTVDRDGQCAGLHLPQSFPTGFVKDIATEVLTAFRSAQAVEALPPRSSFIMPVCSSPANPAAAPSFSWSRKPFQAKPAKQRITYAYATNKCTSSYSNWRTTLSAGSNSTISSTSPAAKNSARRRKASSSRSRASSSSRWR